MESPQTVTRKTQTRARQVEGRQLSDGMYTGMFDDAVGKHGKGTLAMNDGSVYEGSFLNDKFNGYGIIKSKNGDFVKGHWLVGLRDGEFEEVWSEGKEYFKGQYQNNKRNGFGILKFKDGKVYEGEFENGLFHGNGKVIMPVEQMRYEGEFRDGKMSGRGVMLWMDEGGVTYDGEMLDGIRNGFGVYTDKNKNKYIGYWKNDKKDGQGILVTEQGAKYNMVYNMDKEIEKDLDMNGM